MVTACYPLRSVYDTLALAYAPGAGTQPSACESVILCASSESSIDRLIRIQKKHCERLIGVELKQRKVASVRGYNASAHELVQQRTNDFILLYKIIIQLHTLFARNAP